MNKIKRSNKIPAGSIIEKGFENFHYCDSFSVLIITNDSLDKITTDIFQTPKWADALMQFRNSFFKFFGLKKGGYKKDRYIADYYPVGSRAVYFTVIERNEYELVMAENDKHLNFRTSVLTIKEEDYLRIHLITLVQYNNFLGRFYFFIIKPFHRLIIRSLFKRLKN